MRIKGKVIHGPMYEVVVIPRPNNEDLVFKCQAVLNMDTFDKLCPEPTPPVITPLGKPSRPDFEDKDYIKAMEENNRKRFHFLRLESLKATEGLEFETIKDNDPETWSNLQKELFDAGLSPAEVAMIYTGINAANGMNEERLREARERFFTGEKLKALPQ